MESFTRLQTRREVIKKGLIGALFLASGRAFAQPSKDSFAQQSKDPIVMKMFIDFGCPYCQTTLDAVLPFLQGKSYIDFQLKPVLPVEVANNNLYPTPAVRFFYTSKNFLDRTTTLRIASAISLGFKTKADLSSFDSVYQWVMLQGVKLDYQKIKDYYNKFAPRSAFIDAVTEFKYYNIVYVPYIVAETPNGKRIAEWRWNNNSQVYTDSVINFLKER
ncbi:thioredoxin domain-containing protein [Galenea microaerophila]